MNTGKMQRHHSKPSSSTISSVSDTSANVRLSDLSEDIIIYILKRLPVKSIIRFKCVSKDWLSLFSSPKFISMHLEETSKNPQNHSFIIHSWNEDYYFRELSLLSVNSTEREPVYLFNPFQGLLTEIKLVGSVNGLLCLSYYQKEHMIILWNPAINLHKAIRLGNPDEDVLNISLGFAYDSVNEDYKIIRIDSLKPSQESFLRSRAEVYSTSLDSWKSIHIDFPFVVHDNRSKVLAKGFPYWIAFTYCSNRQCECTTEVLMYYDMQKESFKHVTLPFSAFIDGIGKQFVEWKVNLGMITSSPNRAMDYFLQISVHDEMWMYWDCISGSGPIGLKIERPLQCTQGGVILAETKDRKLMLYDHVTNGIKEFCIPGAERFLEAFSYTESLVTIEGMEQDEREVLNFLQWIGWSC